MGEAARLRREKTELEDSLREVEEDLAAARSSLRRMIRPRTPARPRPEAEAGPGQGIRTHG